MGQVSVCVYEVYSQSSFYHCLYYISMYVCNRSLARAVFTTVFTTYVCTRSLARATDIKNMYVCVCMYVSTR
jgi:hypothetical protein